MMQALVVASSSLYMRALYLADLLNKLLFQDWKPSTQRAKCHDCKLQGSDEGWLGPSPSWPSWCMYDQHLHHNFLCLARSCSLLGHHHHAAFDLRPTMSVSGNECNAPHIVQVTRQLLMPHSASNNALEIVRSQHTRSQAQ